MKLKEIEKLCNEALPGPWEFDPQASKREWADIVYYEPYTDDSEGIGEKLPVIQRDSGVYCKQMPTCEFIIASRTIMPKLLEIAKAAKDYVHYSSANNHMALLRKIEVLEEK